MIEIKKHLNVIVLGLVTIVALFGVGVVSILDSRRNMKTLETKNHIKIVMMTDRNCNDCHLGASFVNLFNHNQVKSNDNVANFIMDKVNIRRW